MQISYQSLLNKMGEKVNEARLESADAKIREHVQAIKTLCEVILEETSGNVQREEYVKPVQTQSLTTQSAVMVGQPNTLKEKKLHTDDGANGDSLFDF